METTRETKRKVEQLHDAVAARDAHAHKVRKTEAGRSTAAKSSAADKADAEKAAKAEATLNAGAARVPSPIMKGSILGPRAGKPMPAAAPAEAPAAEAAAPAK